LKTDHFTFIDKNCIVHLFIDVKSRRIQF